LGGSGVQRPLKFVKYLREFGWNPVVVCPEPGAYPYYDHSLLEELNRLAVDVHKVPAKTPFHLPFLKNIKTPLPEKVTEYSRRLLRMFMYPDNKKGWIEAAVQRSVELAEEQSFDMIFSTAPPFSDHIAASELKNKLKIPLVLDYRDAWVNNHFMDDLYEWQKQIHKKMEYSCLKNADRVIVLDRYMRSLIKQDHPELRVDIKIIPHGFDPEDLDGTVEPTLDYKSGKLNFLYSGLFYESNQPDILLNAVKDLAQESKINLNDIHFHFQGGLSPRINELIDDLGLEKSVTDLGYVSHSIAAANLKKADVLWMISNFDPVHKQVKSGKLFEYVGSGKPILGLIHSGAESEFLVNYRAGYMAPPNDIDKVKASVLSILSDWKQGNMKQPDRAYIEQFDRKKLTEELAMVFDTLSSQ
jgi:glycosyltransferase involved in cell wall biosynthesis